MVGPAGLEPATFRPQDGRATRLRHGPKYPLLMDFNLVAREDFFKGVNIEF